MKEILTANSQQLDYLTAIIEGTEASIYIGYHLQGRRDLVFQFTDIEGNEVFNANHIDLKIWAGAILGFINELAKPVVEENGQYITKEDPEMRLVAYDSIKHSREKMKAIIKNENSP